MLRGFALAGEETEIFVTREVAGGEEEVIAQLREIEEMWWSPRITSIEGMGQAWDGRAAVEGKNAWWAQTNRMASGSAEGPYVGATGFSVKFHLEVEDKNTGQRTIMDEIGVYTVKDGKIVQEEFMYGPAAT